MRTAPGNVNMVAYGKINTRLSPVPAGVFENCDVRTKFDSSIDWKIAVMAVLVNLL